MAPSSTRYPNVFVVTYGRSGSTLLQGALNAIPGYLVRGENNDLVGSLLKLVTTVKRPPNKKTFETTNPWYGAGALNRRFLTRSARRFMDGVLLRGMNQAPPRCYGFKEIRYGLADVEQKIAFLEEMYPGCAIIFNTRNPADVARSEFQQKRSVDEFRQLNELFESLSRQAGNRHLVRYEDTCRMDGSFLAMFEFLGEAFDEEAIAAVLRRKHSFHLRINPFFSDCPFFVQIGEGASVFSSLVVRTISRTEQGVTVGATIRTTQPLDPALFDIDGSGTAALAPASPTDPLEEGDTAEGDRFALQLDLFAPVGPAPSVRYAGHSVLRLRNIDRLT